MPVYDATATGAQDGYRNVLGGWIDGIAPTADTLRIVALGVPVDTSYIGMQFVLHSDFNSQDIPLDPALATSFDLTFNVSEIVPVGAADHFIDIYAVPEADPDPYSGALLPGNRDEILLSRQSWDTTGTSVTFSDISTELITEYLRNSSWNGILSLSVRTKTPTGVLGSELRFHSSRAADPTLGPSITTEETPFHTGFWDGSAIGRRARSRHGPRFGVPVASDEMVRDGYTDGMMVSTEEWEPMDPDDKYVPAPLEGVVDDET